MSRASNCIMFVKCNDKFIAMRQNLANCCTFSYFNFSVKKWNLEYPPQHKSSLKTPYAKI